LFGSNGAIIEKRLWIDDSFRHEQFTVLNIRLRGLIQGNTEEYALSDVIRVAIDISASGTCDSVN